MAPGSPRCERPESSRPTQRQVESSELGDDRRLHPRPNRSTGAGGLVRAAPGGLLVNEAFAFEMGVRIAGYTHGHPDAFLSAGVMSALVCRILLGASYAEAVAAMRGDLQNWPGSMPFYKTLDVLAGQPTASSDARSVNALMQGAIAARDEPDAMTAVRRPRRSVEPRPRWSPANWWASCEVPAPGRRRGRRRLRSRKLSRSCRRRCPSPTERG